MEMGFLVKTFSDFLRLLAQKSLAFQTETQKPCKGGH